MSRRKRKRIKFEKNRLRKNMRSIQRRKKRRERKGQIRKEVTYSRETSELLCEKKFFDQSRWNSFMRRSGGRVIIEIPKDFSMATNPDEVISILKRIFCYGMDKNIQEITFDHSKCTNLGIAASTIMDTVVLAAKSYRKTQRQFSDLVISGNYPEDEYTKDVFIGSGLVRHLNLKANERREESGKLKMFRLVSGKYGSEQSDIVATKLTQYFNSCLQTQEYRLTDSGENNLSKMFSEVLDNCEKHGGAGETWHALGHYQVRDGVDYGELQITIFDFGNTIYEQLKSEETTEETKQCLRRMSQIHAPYFSEHWTEEMLYTVYSLQESVSRLRDKNKEGYKNRGSGTITLMTTFFKLCHTMDGKRPELNIISGRTHIRFDETNQPKEMVFHDDVFGNNKRRIVAFNRTNDIYKPAEENVTRLKQEFPGTVIAIKFYIDKKYLDSTVEGG